MNNHFLKSGPDFLMDPRKFRRWMEHLSSKNGNSFHVRLKNLRCGGTINDEQCEIHAVSIVKDEDFVALSSHPSVSPDDHMEVCTRTGIG